MSKLEFNYNDKDYILEYNRNVVQEMESNGYRLTQASDMPATYIPLIFEYAFKMHHRNMKKSDIQEMYDSMEDKEELIAALTEMIGESMNTLFAEPSKNAIKWKKVK